VADVRRRALLLLLLPAYDGFSFDRCDKHEHLSTTTRHGSERHLRTSWLPALCRKTSTTCPCSFMSALRFQTVVLQRWRNRRRNGHGRRNGRGLFELPTPHVVQQLRWDVTKSRLQLLQKLNCYHFLRLAYGYRVWLSRIWRICKVYLSRTAFIQSMATVYHAVELEEDGQLFIFTSSLISESKWSNDWRWVSDF